MIFPPFVKLNVADFVADVLFKGRTELTEIEAPEKRFLEVANKVSEMNKTETEGKTGQQKTTTDEGIKYSLDGKGKRSYSYYDEYATNIMIWANSATTNVGDIKVFKTRNGYALLEATEDGYIELERGNYKEVSKYYDEMQRQADNSVYGYAKEIRANQGGNLRSKFVDNKLGEINVGNSRQVGGKGFQSNTTGNNENLRRGNKGEQSLKLSLPETDNESEYSLPPNATVEQVGDAYKNGEISREEYAAEMERLFSDKVAEQGAIKQGEMVAPPNKKVPTPKSVSDGTLVRQHARTILESGYATPEILLGGLASGLASTGVYESVHQFIKKD